MERKYIIFGRNVGNVLGQIRSFGEVGIKSIVVYYGFCRHNPSSSKYIEKYIDVKSAENGLEYIIDEYGNSQIKHILSTDNDGIVSLLDKNYDRLKDSFYFFNCGEQGRLSKMMEKKNLCELADKVGLNSPKSKIIKIGELNHGINYPIFIKSIDSFDVHWKNTVSICNNEEDLKNYYIGKSNNKEVLIQEYINKKNEYILQGISINGGNELYLPIEGHYYRFPADAYGSYLYFEKFNENKDLFNKLQQMFIEIKYSGVFEIEFIVNKNDELFFLEINFRHTLWNHTFTNMGINLSTIWANSEIAGHLVTNNATLNCKRNNLMNEFIDFKRCRKDKKISIFHWIKDLFQTNSFVIYDKKDKKPFFSYIKSIITQK